MSDSGMHSRATSTPTVETERANGAGHEWSPPSTDSASAPSAPVPSESADGSDPSQSTKVAASAGSGKKVKPKKPAKPEAKAKATPSSRNRDGMETEKSADFAKWYQEVITKGELIEYYDVSGCYVLRPRSFAIWDCVRDFVDRSIKHLGVENAYFPLFVSAKRLATEKEHLDGFEAEVAWVTKSGRRNLDEHIAVRPTSEVIMYPYFAKWIRSHRDLPLKVNQWSNVVRWEMSDCTPFLRSREFLWQEGHTAYANREEADAEVLQILNLYKAVYEELLAVPMIRGTKTNSEKFAGALYTTTIEGFIPASGRAIQAATSHALGQNFSKMFNIQYLTDDNVAHNVWQNSWGITTRSIGVMIMVHSDNRGLVIPPRVAPLKAVVVPIVQKGKVDDVRAAALVTTQQLQAAGLVTKLDDRSDKTPGWKFSYWELRGVPIRLELGPRDLEQGNIVLVRRDTSEKKVIAQADMIVAVQQTLEQMQVEMLARARAELQSRIRESETWSEFMDALNAGCLALVPWCTSEECEARVKERTDERISKGSANDVVAASLKNSWSDAMDQGQQLGEAMQDVRLEEAGEAAVEGLKASGAAKTLCIPFPEELLALNVKGGLKEKCFACENRAETIVLWGRSY